jgi:hypothetical protein
MSIFGRVLHRATLRLARGVVQHRGRLLIIFALIAGVIAVSSFNLFPVSGPSLSGQSVRGRGGEDVATTTYQGTDSEPPSTASYIRGLQTGDARLVWNAYSDRAARDLQRRGVTPDETQKQLDQSRQNGSAIQGVQYVGAHPIPNGSMHFYVISRGGRTRGDVAYVPYVFTLDSAGKIERID